jgi:hypothetical protein
MKKITSVLTLVFAVSILIAGCADTLIDPVEAANEELNAEGNERRSVTVGGSTVKIKRVSVTPPPPSIYTT